MYIPTISLFNSARASQISIHPSIKKASCLKQPCLYNYTTSWHPVKSPTAKICVPDKLHSLVQTHLSCSLLCMLISIMLLISINILCLAWWRCKNGLHGFAYFAQFRLQFSKTHIPRLVVACCELKSVAPKTSLLLLWLLTNFHGHNYRWPVQTTRVRDHVGMFPSSV